MVWNEHKVNKWLLRSRPVFPVSFKTSVVDGVSGVPAERGGFVLTKTELR